MRHNWCFLALFALFGASPAVPKDSLGDVVARMDQAAKSFQSMSADATFLTHTDVINEDARESGRVVMKRNGANEVQGVIEFTEPANARRSVAFSARKAQIYYPKLKTVQIYDLGKGGEQIDQFIMLGFGTSGSELAKGYAMKALGAETVNGVPALKLELTPKSQQAKQYVTRVEMWTPEQGAPYPIQEKVYEPSGDYRLITYSNLKINPTLKNDALKLKLPAGVKTEYPQK